MSQSVVMRDAAASSQAGGGTVFAGIFLMSLSSLLLELSLTRVFSVTLFYHFAFLAISIALLGLGAGGVFAFIRRDWLAQWDILRLGATASFINAFSIGIVLLVVLRIPVSLDLTGLNFLRLSAIYLLSAVPFFFTGLVFSIVFARETSRIAALYGADLVGGAVACVAVVPLLNGVGGPNAIVLAAAGMALASAVWSSSRKWRRIPLSLALAFVVLVAVNLRGRLIDVVYTKGENRGARTLFTRWNAISRIAVEQWGNARYITIDSDAGTALMNADPHGWKNTPAEHGMMSAPPALASVLRPHGDFGIIGPGGGVDVVRAIGYGSPSVTGIEINPLIANTIMRDRYADYAHHIYEIPEVHLNVGDGRSWIRASKQRFDVLQMTLVDTWASTSAGAFALSENNLYTVQAFKEYFEHLKPGGIVVITRWEFKRPREGMRVVSVAMQALHELGVGDTSRNFIVVSDGPLNTDGVTVGVVAKKTPFTAEEQAVLREHLASNPNLIPVYLPGQTARGPYPDLIASNDPYGFARHYEFNVAPVTDDQPFFFFTMKTAEIFRHGFIRGMDWKVNVGVAVLLMVLVISLLATGLFLILPMSLTAGSRPRSQPMWFFIMVGLGFILVEIAFIQRFVLFLGHPTYALTVVVFLMLLASGAGSMLSRRWLADPGQVRLPLSLLIAAVALYVVILPRVLSAGVGLAFPLKLAISAALLAPLGVLMGMPFPTGLRALHGAGEETVEWAWAMNAASSVLGSVLAMVIAIQYGLTVVLFCGAAAYLIATVLTVRFGTHAQEKESSIARVA